MTTCSCNWLGSNTSAPWPFLRANFEAEAGAIEPGEDCAPCPLTAGTSCATGLYTDLAAGDNGACVPCPAPTAQILSSVALALGGVGLLLALWKMSGRESRTMMGNIPTDAEVYSGKQQDIVQAALALKQPLLEQLGCDEELASWHAKTVPHPPSPSLTSPLLCGLRPRCCCGARGFRTLRCGCRT